MFAVPKLPFTIGARATRCEELIFSFCFDTIDRLSGAGGTGPIPADQQAKLGAFLTPPILPELFRREFSFWPHQPREKFATRLLEIYPRLTDISAKFALLEFLKCFTISSDTARGQAEEYRAALTSRSRGI